MRIIKKGNPERIDPIYRFVCYFCGCEWEALRSECKLEEFIGSIEYGYNCPTCNKLIFGKVKR